jgi:class I lanthipeptide synthase
MRPVDHANSWRPVLDDELRRRAFEAFEDIAASLCREPNATSSSLIEVIREASLGDGQAGLALFYAYASQARPGYADDQLALEFLEQAIDTLAAAPMSPALYSGFTGVAWVSAHLSDPADEDPNESIDKILLELLSRPSWPFDYDLINGLVGIGVYLLERLPHPTAAQCLQRIFDFLDEMAQRVPEGITWWTPPKLLPANERKDFPRGLYNLGVAHGVPGVIGFFSSACSAGVANDRSKTLLQQAVNWVLEQRSSRNAGCVFPYSVGPGVSRIPARLAWCYGDAGIAVMLLHAARSMNESTWKREAIDLALHAAECSIEESGVVDAALCHGAAGLGHIFNRIYNTTLDTRFADAARFWFEHALRLRDTNKGVAGFSALKPGASGKNEWVADPGFLTGAAGIGLALLAATASIEPEWDRVMLLSPSSRPS